MYPQDTQKGKDNLNNHDAEKIDIHQQKNEAGILSITMYKHGLKGFSGGPRVKNPPANAGDRRLSFDS